MRKHTCIECGQSPPALSWHEVEDDQWVDTDCYRKRQARVLLADEFAAANARADAAEMALSEMRAALQSLVDVDMGLRDQLPRYLAPGVGTFLAVRGILKVQDAKNILATSGPDRGAALLAAAREMTEVLRVLGGTGAWFINQETGAETYIAGCHPRCAAAEAHERWRAALDGQEAR